MTRLAIPILGQLAVVNSKDTEFLVNRITRNDATTDPYPMTGTLCADSRVTRYLDPQTAWSLMNAHGYVGNAPQRANSQFAQNRIAW